MKKQCIILLPFLLLLLCAEGATLYAQELVFLTNGDRLSGSITQEMKDTIIFNTEMLGTLTISKKNIEKITSPKAIEEKALDDAEIIIEWTREFEAGYNIETGNTEKDSIHGAVHINRKTDKTETTLTGNANQSSSDSKMDDQKWDTLARFAYSFGKQKKWYHYVKNELDHDKFAKIDYREIPSTGIGYWFSDKNPFKLMTEIGGGYEYIEYNDDTENSEAVKILPRLYAEWNIVGDVRLSEELASYHSIDDYNEYRVVSTTTLTNPITENLSFKVRLIDEYENEPAEDARNNDLRLESLLAYSF